MRENLFLFSENRETTELNYTDLYFYYKKLGLVEMSDIKYVGWFEEEFIPNRITLGDNIFYKGEQPYDRQIIAQKGKQKLTFSSIEKAIEYIKQNKISTASDGTIMRTILKNLQGKTKSGYKFNWSIE